MATVNTEAALAEYQRRVGALMNEIIMRDVAIAGLENDLAAAQKENRELRASGASPQLPKPLDQDTRSAV